MNFRQLSPKEKKSESVEVTNLGDKPLKIISISSSYDFININLADLKLPVSLKHNEKMKFKVGVDASKMKEKTWGQVVMSTDNPHTPQVSLYVRGRVQNGAQRKTAKNRVSIPQIAYSQEAMKLFPHYNFTYNNITRNLATCNGGRCIPMKSFIQLLVNKRVAEKKITSAIQQIYGPRAIVAGSANRLPLKESIKKALKDKPKAKLELFAMSYCPFAVRAEKALAQAAANFGSKLDLHIYFIARSKTGGDSDQLGDLFTSLHGPKEVEEDLRQVLIQKYFPEKLLPYLRLRNQNVKDTDWKECAIKAGIDVKKMEKLIADKKSRDLLRENLAKAQTMNVHASPTLLINNVRYQGGFR